MYAEYYGLVRAPFEMTPDPSFLYLGEAHREGLATLVYAVNSGKGFVMLTGEVGTGKTTLLHALLSQLDSNTPSAFIFNPRLEALDFFRVVFDEPQHAVAPGQGAAFYRGDRLLGGGWIARTEPAQRAEETGARL